MVSRIVAFTKNINLRGILVLSLILLMTAYYRLYIVDAIDASIPNKLQDFITLSLSIFIEAFPFLVLGSLLAAAVNTYVSHEFFHKILPKKPVFRRTAMSFLGFLLPVCECGNVPLSRALMIQGFKPSESVTFLLAAPVINPVTIWSTWAAFSYDGSILIARIAATLLIANIIGFVISLVKNQEQFLTNSFAKVCQTPKSYGGEADASNRFQLRRFSRLFTHEAFAMISMLALGAMIAGTIQTFVPRDILVGIGSNVILAIVAMLLLAFVVSICATVDAFFALSFANTFTAGSLVSFMVFGPMIDIKMLTLMKTTFKTNILLVISAFSLIQSFITGIIFTYAF